MTVVRTGHAELSRVPFLGAAWVNVSGRASTGAKGPVRTGFRWRKATGVWQGVVSKSAWLLVGWMWCVTSVGAVGTWCVAVGALLYEAEAAERHQQGSILAFSRVDKRSIAFMKEELYSLSVHVETLNLSWPMEVQNPGQSMTSACTSGYYQPY